jgi:hypothetical protein
VLPLPPALLRIVRLLRLLRVLRLLKGAKEIRDLIMTMVLSFPSLLNIGSLLALVVFIYAVLGRSLFAFLEHQVTSWCSRPNRPCFLIRFDRTSRSRPLLDVCSPSLVPGRGPLQDVIDEVRNFETLGNGALLLFQVLTGDAWSSVMAEAMLTPESGRCSGASCGTWLAVPYFISFQLIGSFVFLNLVVAVILENFSSLGKCHVGSTSHPHNPCVDATTSTYHSPPTDVLPLLFPARVAPPGSVNPFLVSAADVEAFKEVSTCRPHSARTLHCMRALHPHAPHKRHCIRALFSLRRVLTVCATGVGRLRPRRRQLHRRRRPTGAAARHAAANGPTRSRRPL